MCWLLNNDLLKISAKLVISLKHNTIFAEFLEILLDNKLLEFIFSDFPIFRFSDIFRIMKTESYML